MFVMEMFFCIMLFCMGALFGSFFTLAVYRIPLGLDITHERSFCPNCNHRLEFIDLIPIFSYLSLGGKCRYCGKSVRIRYLLLEVLSGLVFVTAYFAFNLNFPFFQIETVNMMIGFVMFYITNAIILGIDKEYRNIDKRVLLFGIITQSIYMLFLYTTEKISIIYFIICLVIMLVVFCIDTYILKIKNKSFYILSIIELIIYEVMVIQNWKIIIGAGILSIVFYGVYKMYRMEKVPIGFCMSISSIVSVLIGNLYLI